MGDFLTEMARESAQRAVACKVSFTAQALDQPAFPLQLDGFDLIAEIKDRSPAEGPLASPGESRTTRAMKYAQGGAAAISVLTEPRRFDGQLAHLEEVVKAVSPQQIPVMRKDFLVDTLQILEAKAAGASGVLLIAAILSDKQMQNMLDCAIDNDLFVLLEAFEEDDLERATKVSQSRRIREQAEKQKFLVGVNTRDLRVTQCRSAAPEEVWTAVAGRCHRRRGKRVADAPRCRASRGVGLSGSFGRDGADACARSRGVDA